MGCPLLYIAAAPLQLPGCAFSEVADIAKSMDTVGATVAAHGYFMQPAVHASQMACVRGNIIMTSVK